MWSPSTATLSGSQLSTSTASLSCPRPRCPRVSKWATASSASTARGCPDYRLGRSWTQDASRLAAAIARMQSHCDEAVTVWMPVWGLGGSLIAHLDEYVIPAWARGRAAALAEKPYAQGEANSTKFLWAAADDTLPCTTWYGCYWEPLSPCDGRRRLLVRRHAVWRRSIGRFERRWGGLLFRSAVLAHWWRPSPILRERVDAGVRAIFTEDTPRCVAVHVRRGDACRTPWRKCPSLTIARGSAPLQQPLQSKDALPRDRRRGRRQGRARDLGEKGRAAAVAQSHFL